MVRTHWAVNSFSLKVYFDDVLLSALTSNSKATVKLSNIRYLKQEEAATKPQRSTGNFPFKCSQGWVNFNSSAAGCS